MSAFAYPPIHIEDRDEYTTVFLRKRKDNIEHLFYCFHCQMPVFKYQGSVALAVTGDSTEIMKAPFKIKCKGKMRTFSHDGEIKRITSEKRCPITYIVEGFVETLQN